jgi:hypothetical protein
MDPRPRLQKATRFFARPEAFTLECPHCGQIYRIGRHQKQPCWDPTMARFTCSNALGCGKRYIIGIVAWPIRPGLSKTGGIPRDQVPYPRQLAQLRAEGGGWWLTEEDQQRTHPIHETNLTPEPDRPDRDDDDDELEEP